MFNINTIDKVNAVVKTLKYTNVPAYTYDTDKWMLYSPVYGWFTRELTSEGARKYPISEEEAIKRLTKSFEKTT